jgi:hypothetical protein
MGLPNTVKIKAGNQLIDIQAFNAQQAEQSLSQQSVQILASGPSVAELTFTDEILAMATIFVNGSLSLLGQHDFKSVVGYVISDARFVNHQTDILTKYYQGQPLYATLAVFEAIAASQPEIFIRYHESMRVIFPVDRPWGVQVNKPWHGRLPLAAKLFDKHWLNRKKPLAEFASHPSFVIDSQSQPQAIGVSLDMSHGFVEAGTVAYVAAQLAYAREAAAIHLYGIDLLNSNQPRFYENKDNSAPSKLDKAISDRIVPSFNLMGQVYREHGVSVINHSPISKDLFSELEIAAHN